MNIKRDMKGGVSIELSKPEVTRLMEASFILDGVIDNANADARTPLKHAVNVLRHNARSLGANHFDESGEIKKPERQKAVDASAPTG